jgi:Methyltransferase FkbM domain
LKEISVPVVTLESIITDYFPDGLELLSLDTEGLDLALLKSLNYEKHRPLAICVETVGFSETLAKPKNNVITSILAPHGYAPYADTFVNTIYIDTKRTGTVAL